MENNSSIWPGSASFFPGDTPFGTYDYDDNFQCDVEKVALWCARRLGYPIIEIELTQEHFFAAFEEAINEYGKQINTYQARDNILTLMGLPTGSLDLSNEYVEPTAGGLIKLSSQYGTEAGSGGNFTYFTGSLNILADRQVYDLKSGNGVNLESGDITKDSIIIRRFFYQPTPSVLKYLDPMTTLGSQELIDQFGFGGSTIPAGNLLMPLYADVLRMQQLEFNEMLRKNTYSFQYINGRLRIFPIPKNDYTLHFHYTLDNENSNNVKNNGKITNYSNIPYGFIPYKSINQIGRQWIKKYTLALTKEILGYIRGKYGDVPIPDGSVTLNSADLITAAQTEQEALITELKEMLDQFSRQSQLERKNSESDALSSQLSKYPTKIYIR